MKVAAYPKYIILDAATNGYLLTLRGPDGYMEQHVFSTLRSAMDRVSLHLRPEWAYCGVAV